MSESTFWEEAFKVMYVVGLLFMLLAFATVFWMIMGGGGGASGRLARMSNAKMYATYWREIRRSRNANDNPNLPPAGPPPLSQVRPNRKGPAPVHLEPKQLPPAPPRSDA